MRLAHYRIAAALAILAVAVFWGGVFPPTNRPALLRQVQSEPPVHDNTAWDAFCETTDCSRIPEGYTTYVLEPYTYYFPSYDLLTEQFPQIGLGFAIPRDHVEWREDGTVRRSFSGATRLRIRACCNAMLAHYGLIDADALSETAMGPGVTGWMRIYAQTWFAISDHHLGPLSDYISEDQLSYNDDFWLLSTGDLTGLRQVRRFTVLSKEPLLNGYRVRAICSTYCDIATVAFDGDGENTRPHIEMEISPNQGRATRRSAGFDRSLFRCNPEDLADGCDPAAPIFDEVPRMLGLLDTMFEMARVHPAGLDGPD